MAHAKEACSHCLSCCFHCCSQIADPLQKGRVALSHCLRVQGLVGKTLQQMCLAAGHVTLQSGNRERWRLTLCLHYPLSSTWDPSPWDDTCLDVSSLICQTTVKTSSHTDSEVSSGWFQVQSMRWWGLTITTSRPDVQAWLMHLKYTLSLSFYAYLLNNSKICAILSWQKLPILHIYSRSHQVVVLYHLC